MTNLSVASFDDIKQSLANFPVIEQQAQQNFHHPRLAVFIGAHGFFERDGQEEAHGMLQEFISTDGDFRKKFKSADIDLRVYEMGLNRPTADMTQGPSMSEEGCVHAMAYGMTCVEEGVDLLSLACSGGGTKLSTLALLAAIQDTQPIGEQLELALAANPSARQGGFEALRCLGGYEMAAVVGAVIAARMAKIPVVLDNLSALAAALVLEHYDKEALAHCQMAQKLPFPFSSSIDMQSIQTDSFKEIGDATLAAIKKLRQN